MAVTATDIITTLNKTIPSEVLAKLDPVQSLLDQGLDSLALTAMAVALQEKYKIKLSVDDSMKLKTINDIAAFVNAKVEQS